MQFEYSLHWRNKKVYHPEITDDVLELCILNSPKIRDRTWENVWNAIAPIPPSGNILKVAYKEKGKVIKILTAYWL